MFRTADAALPDDSATLRITALTGSLTLMRSYSFKLLRVICVSGRRESSEGFTRSQVSCNQSCNMA